MICECITIEDCAERHVYWSRIEMQCMMNAWGNRMGLTCEAANKWEEATNNARMYWLYGLDEWGRDFSLAEYNEREKHK